MSNREIQIRFPKPGEWGRFKMLAVYDKAGYRHQDELTEADVPEGMRGAFEGVVRALVGIGGDWQAEGVTARLVLGGGVCDDGGMEGEVAECVELRVEAVNGCGGRRVFTRRDYDELLVRDAGAVEFFKFFTA